MMELQTSYLYTPERREEIKRDLARRKRLVLLLLGNALVIATAVIVIQQLNGSVFGVAPRTWVPILIGYLALECFAAVQLWRCPSCRRRLPLELNPANCSRCGALFK